MCSLIRHVSNPPRGDSDQPQSATFSRRPITDRPRSPTTISSYRVVRVAKCWNRKSVDGVDRVAFTGLTETASTAQRSPVHHHLRWATYPLPSFPHRAWAAAVSSIVWYVYACTPAIRQREGQDLYNRQRVEVKVDGQGQTANFLHLPIDSMAKNEGNLDDRSCLYSRLRAIRSQ